MDLELFTSDLKFHQERLWTDSAHQPLLVALKVLQKLEADSADFFRLRATNPLRKVGVEPNWASTLVKKFGKVNQYLELGYALTTHKAQGSDFDVVFGVIPRDAATLSRELLYTALTRFRKRLVLLVENNLEPLLRLRAPEESDTEQRNTQMFAVHLRPADRANRAASYFRKLMPRRRSLVSRKSTSSSKIFWRFSCDRFVTEMAFLGRF
jgi:hypothetical protein